MDDLLTSLLSSAKQSECSDLDAQHRNRDAQKRTSDLRIVQAMCKEL